MREHEVPLNSLMRFTIASSLVGAEDLSTLQMDA